MRIFFVLLAVVISGCAVITPASVDEIHKARSLVTQGVQHLRLGQLDRARASFEVAYQIANLPEAIDGLGCVSFIEGDLDQAERYFVEAYERDPEYVHVLGNLSLLYEARGEKKLADKLYRLALRENPENFRVRNNYAVFLQEAGTKGGRQAMLKAMALSDHPLMQQNLKQLGK